VCANVVAMTTPRKLNPPTMSLEGKVALITGCSRVIVAATVRMFVQAGARVVFNYQRATNEAEKLVAECGSDLCHAVQADLNGTSQAEKLVRAAVERCAAHGRPVATPAQAADILGLPTRV